MEEAVEFANELAPEHLEVCAENPMVYLGRLDNAGSVFLGHYSPEPLGDYFAGPNHVLPHERHGPLLLAPFGGQLREEVELHLLHARKRCFPRRTTSSGWRRRKGSRPTPIPSVCGRRANELCMS